MSAAVIPMRRTVSAPAICGSATTGGHRQHRRHGPAFSGILGTHRNQSLLDFSMTISYAIHATAVPMAIIVRLIVIAITTLCRSAVEKMQYA